MTQWYTQPLWKMEVDYRPISLLSLISKMLEKHIHTILSDFCISHNLISPRQFGFLPQRSTVSALLFSTHSILSLLESCQSVCGIFLDLRKAFDSVPHQPLIDLLASHDLPPHLLNWLHSYLLNRSQRVVVRGSTSSPLPASSGVPQGSILGPLLFILYINGLTNLPLSPLTQSVFYADDIFLFRPISSPADLTLLQADLDSISSWLSTHFLHLNPSKSMYMFFSRKSPSLFNQFPPLTISLLPIERVSSFKYLGVLLTPSLSWSPHISSICKKARKILGLIFRHFYRHSSPVTILDLYTSLVRPHLEYCSPLWNPSSPTLTRSLESVQLFAIKLANKFRTPLPSSSQAPFNIPSLASRRQYASLVLLFKLFHHHLDFPSPILTTNPTPPYSTRSYHPNNFLQLPLRTSSFKSSFFPATIPQWNSLPPSLKETFSLSLFKSSIKDILF